MDDATDGEADTVSRTVIEPKISKVDVDVIPVKEARRVLNNRNSARKSYIRKKEVGSNDNNNSKSFSLHVCIQLFASGVEFLREQKMKSMEERVARYEVDFANVNREYLRLWEDYKRLQEENQVLRLRVGCSAPSQTPFQPPSQRPAPRQL